MIAIETERRLKTKARYQSIQKQSTVLPKVYEALPMEAMKKPEQPGFAALMKGFPHTDPYKCILCGHLLRFTNAEADRHATELLYEKLNGISRKRWYLAEVAG